MELHIRLSLTIWLIWIQLFFMQSWKSLQICVKHQILEMLMPFIFICMVLIGEKAIEC
jgi:hypothetical protein